MNTILRDRQAGYKLAQKPLAATVKAELRWRDCCYPYYCPMTSIKGLTAIVVDNDIATGSTMHAAIKVLRQHQPPKLLLQLE